MKTFLRIDHKDRHPVLEELIDLDSVVDIMDDPAIDGTSYIVLTGDQRQNQRWRIKGWNVAHLVHALCAMQDPPSLGVANVLDLRI